MKHHVGHCVSNSAPQGISHQICRNIATRKIYLHINLPTVSSALKKMYQKAGILLYIFFFLLYCL